MSQKFIGVRHALDVWFEQLDTPFPVADLDVVERNIARMQAYCDAHGIRLRPHIKTHKIPRLAHMQVEAGACGIACQKLGEAEVMAGAGIQDILITYPLVGRVKAERLAALLPRAAIAVALDGVEAIETVAWAASAAAVDVGVLVEFDSGAGRTGVRSPSAALALAQQIDRTTGLRFEGLMTYPNTPATAGFVQESKVLFQASGIEIRTVSGGGTPVAWSAHEIPGLTEMRVGAYIYNDRSEVGSGASIDHCALHVHATVVSRPTDDRAILDSGSKALTNDLFPSCGQGYGLIREYPDAVVSRLYEEHALVDVTNCESRPSVGEQVRVLPNHACVVSNLHDQIAVARSGEVIDFWAVEARGKSR